ncbi:MAG TPA: DUF4129 domain-containing protein [Flavobacteriia bacterium]|nr:DUF4129 domain-containing protein [Flavobacteriia bacterium]
MKHFYLYICLFFTTFSLVAQQDSTKVSQDKLHYDTSQIEQRKFDNGRLDTYRNDTDFNYEVKKRKPTFLERVWNWFLRVLQRFLTWLFGVEKATGILAVIVKVLPYLIAAIVLFLLIKFFLKVNMNSIISGKTDKAIVHLSEEEELLKNEDLSVLIQKAIEQKNYRLAIRYHYLLALQKLTKYELIDWQQQKTNEDYINEIKHQNLKNKFASSTYLYDFVWYGNFEINAPEFAKAAAEFDELNKLIK